MVKSTISRGALSILAFLWLPVLVFSQKENKEGYINGVRCVYSLENGQMNGAYTSFYANGIKKSEGQFQHNTRVGKWTIWDSTGQMTHQRVYDNNAYDYSVLFDKSEGDKPALSKKQIVLARDTNGLTAFQKVAEKDIVHSVIIWRMLDNKQQNPALLGDNTFFNALTARILDGKIRAYSATNDKFKNRITPEELTKTMDSLDVELVGFRTKEMRYYIASRQITEVVILGLAPIVRSKKAGNKAENTPLFWVYMPNARKELAQISLPNTGFPTDIKTYDDLFFNRYFSSTIIKTSNPKSLYLDDYLRNDEVLKAAQKIEMDNIDLEHNLWVYKPNARK
jgi:antitoxin component YwqK of YwqJK toxin-antitoxin module